MSGRVHNRRARARSGNAGRHVAARAVSHAAGRAFQPTSRPPLHHHHHHHLTPIASSFAIHPYHHRATSRNAWNRPDQALPAVGIPLLAGRRDPTLLPTLWWRSSGPAPGTASRGFVDASWLPDAAPGTAPVGSLRRRFFGGNAWNFLASSSRWSFPGTSLRRPTAASRLRRPSFG